MRFLLPLLCLCVLTQCQKKIATPTDTPALEGYTYHQMMMGTRFSINLYAADSTAADAAAKEAFQYAANVNRACSDYDVTSELMQVNSAPANQPIKISPMLLDVLQKALNIAKQTNGTYDPTLGWHSYNWRMARKKNALPTSAEINRAQKASGWQKISLDLKQHTVTKLAKNMRLDLGGIAKGYAADGMLEILKKHSITRTSIVAGGEILLGDPPPHKEGWKMTFMTLDTQYTITPKNLTTSNCAISTSGDIYQSITINNQRYSHVVDPATGLGLTQRISATIIAPNTTTSDALATAYCVNPKLTYPNIKKLIVFEKEDGSLGKKGQIE